MGRIIAIDYGKKRIGLAMTDENKILALPYKTVEAGNTIKISVQNILNELKPYIPKTEKIIIGLPLLLSGKKAQMAIEVEKLKEELQKKTDIPIDFWDERLTSAQAEVSLKEIKLSRKKRAQKSDPVAATIILQNYLDAIKN